jgi:hypothetical protein
MSSFFKLWSSRVNVGSSETFVGDEGRIFYDESERILRISDGKTPGGIPLFGGTSTADPIDRGDLPTQSPSTQIKKITIELTGLFFILKHAEQNINTIISSVVIDSNGQEVSVVMKRAQTEISLESNTLLDGHFLVLSYL